MRDGRIDLGAIDTTPGARSPLAPPLGWEGDADAWWDLMRDRYRCDPLFRQQLAVVVHGRSIALLSITGPFAVAARALLRRLKGEV